MVRNSRILKILITLVLITSVSSTAVYAEGPGTGGRRVKMDQEAAGPYLVRVVTSPTPPKVDNYYLEIRVMDAESGEIIRDMDVLVKAIPVEGQWEPLEAVATHDIAPIPGEYAAHLLIPTAGVWEVQVLIDGELGAAQVSFLERITTPSALGPILSVGAPFAGLVILIVAFLWLQRKSQGSEGKLNSKDQNSFS